MILMHCTLKFLSVGEQWLKPNKLNYSKRSYSASLGEKRDSTDTRLVYKNEQYFQNLLLVKATELESENSY